MVGSILNFFLTYWPSFALVAVVALAASALTLALVYKERFDGTKILHASWRAVRAVLTWKWTKKLLYWLIISAGTMSECAFLLASLWMSINSSVHPLVRLVLSETATRNVSYLATAAYVALPECILGLAVVTVINHVRMYFYSKHATSIVWSILFGLPTVVFVVLSLITLGCSVVSVNFIMPLPFVVTRALAGYVFAFASLLHNQLGEPQERDRLEERDALIKQLRQENEDNLSKLRQEKDTIILALRREVESQKDVLVEYKNAHAQLLNMHNKSSEDALQAYSEECKNWLKSGIKTASIDEITRYTGHTKRKIDGAITKGSLQTATRNKELILVSSLSEWLKNTPPSAAKILQFPAEKEPSTDPVLQAQK